MKLQLRLVGVVIVVLAIGGGGWMLGRHRSEEAKRQDAIAKVEAFRKTQDAEPETDKVKLYMIAVGDNGKSGKLVGCNDSLVEVTRTFPETDYLSGAYEELLSLKDVVYPQTQLQNPLSRSALKVESATIADDGTAKVVLSGTLDATDDCDKVRIAAQLREPALRFWGVKVVEITVNGTSL